MLKLYDYLETILEEQNNRQWYFETRLNYLASEIMEKLEIEDPEEINTAITRVLEVCNQLHIPFNRNFKKIYRFDGENMSTDWKISPLACYLIIINCSPTHEGVAKAQLYFAMNQVAHN